MTSGPTRGARLGNGHVALADMDPVGADLGSRRHVVIDDEKRPGAGKHLLQRSSGLDHPGGAALLVAQLHHGRAAGDRPSRGLHHADPVAKLRVEHQVERQVERLHEVTSPALWMTASASRISGGDGLQGIEEMGREGARPFRLAMGSRARHGEMRERADGGIERIAGNGRIGTAQARQRTAEGGVHRHQGRAALDPHRADPRR